MEKYYSVVSFVGDNISAAIDFLHNERITTKSDIDEIIKRIIETDFRLKGKTIFITNIFTVLNK